ncbi:hypothetical protein ACH5RR_039373 [Cinchona calisaya]|uniref:Uncharacterized protein n=1 Tax=Cinchona calisaya TaxID=153742 RepID=A0ABD2Y246_9GENT
MCPLPRHGRLVLTNKVTPSYELSSLPPKRMEHCFALLDALDPVSFVFHKAALFSIASLVGNPLKIDASTASGSRLGKVRLCVNLDVAKPDLHQFWVNNGEKGKWQSIQYEDVPDYCKHCLKMVIQKPAV